MLCQLRYVNNFDETFVYECTTGAGVITGATKVTICIFLVLKINSTRTGIGTGKGTLYWYRCRYIHCIGNGTLYTVQVQVLEINSSCTGMESEHDNHSEDRRWSYKCCAAQVESSTQFKYKSV